MQETTPVPQRSALIGLRSLFAGFKAKHRETFYFQLATMLSAGVTLREALYTLSGSLDPAGKAVAVSLAEGVGAGAMLSEVMARHPEVFRAFDLTMVRTGEMTGRLDESLKLMGELTGRYRRIRTRAATAMIYPLIILHVGVVLLNVPHLVTAGWWTFVLGCLKTFLPLYLVVGGGVFVHYLWRDARAYGNFLFSIPVLGPLLLKMALARSSRAIAVLYDAGLPLARAVKSGGEAVGNSELAETLRDASRRLDQGQSMTDALAEADLLPRMVKDMIRTGEHSGMLGASLSKVAEYYDHETETALTRAAKVVPVVVYIVILCALGYQVILFWSDLIGTVTSLV